MLVEFLILNNLKYQRNQILFNVASSVQNRNIYASTFLIYEIIQNLGFHLFNKCWARQDSYYWWSFRGNLLTLWY